jgi:putative nucleotidyltransferase with HDIG domain
VRRILFVDDEQLVLDGLERMLFDLGDEWELEFADSGEAGLAAMATEPFDVVVSDMRMPGMDGAAFLARVQDQYPSTVRIVLSGHTESEPALRAAAVAHQFLSKPCASDVIRNVVSRACELRDLLSQDSLKKVVAGMKTLPALPRVYNALVSALADPEVALEDVAAIVEQDAAITAKILQLVNSSFFGLSRTIGSIQQATGYLGMNMLRDLVLSMEVFRAFERGDAPEGFSLEYEQAHATRTARVARNLFEDKAMRENAFAAAMLHDVGKLIHATMLPKSYEEAILLCSTGRTFHDAEQDVIGVSHAEIGAFLLGIWGMPYPIVEAVAHHHHPARVSHGAFDLVGATHVANALAHEQERLESSEPSCSDELDTDYLESVGVADRISEWREMAAAECEEKDEAA